MSKELSFKPNDTFELYKAYMPFVVGGAIFINTDKLAELGETISVALKFPLESEDYLFDGKVIWVSPEKTLFEQTISGVGVSIEGEKKELIRHKIESLVAEFLASEQPTDTM